MEVRLQTVESELRKNNSKLIKLPEDFGRRVRKILYSKNILAKSGGMIRNSEIV